MSKFLCRALLPLCLFLLSLVFVSTAIAGFKSFKYDSGSGEEPTMLVRANNNDIGVGWIGGFFVKDIFEWIRQREIPDVKGFVCSNLKAKDLSAATTVFDGLESIPQVRMADASGNVVTWNTPDFVDYIEQLNGWSIEDTAFVPIDINDNNIIVGTLFLLLNTDPTNPDYPNNTDAELPAAVPFIWDYPDGIPLTLIGGFNEFGGIVLPGQADNSSGPVNLVLFSGLIGINNKGQITGFMAGLLEGFLDGGPYCSVCDGFKLNIATASDGIVSSNELEIINGGGLLFTLPLSINESGNIVGVGLSVKIPPTDTEYIVDAEGDKIKDNNGEYMFGPPQDPDWPDYIENLSHMRAVKVMGFIEPFDSGNGDLRFIDYVDDEDMEADQSDKKAEVYGTFPYTISDYGNERIFFGYTKINPLDANGDYFFTFDTIADVLLELFNTDSSSDDSSGSGGSPEEPAPMDFSKAFPLYMVDAPYNEQDFSPQTDLVPVPTGADEIAIAGINSGMIIGIYGQDGQTPQGEASLLEDSTSFVQACCNEKDNGSLDIGPISCQTGPNTFRVPIWIHGAENDVASLGFDVIFSENVEIEFEQFIPGELLDGWEYKAGNGDEINFSNGIENGVRIGAFTNDEERKIGYGESGILGYIEITMTSLECAELTLDNLVDDLCPGNIGSDECEPWKTSSGCLNPNTQWTAPTGDIDGNGEITPKDALCAFQNVMGCTGSNSCGGGCNDAKACDVNLNCECDPYDPLCIFKAFLKMTEDECANRLING